MNAGPLMDAWLSHERGETPEKPRHRTPPDHLRDQRWKCSCECGYSWFVTGDAVWRDGQWQGPERECTVCFTFVAGRHCPGPPGAPVAAGGSP